MHRIGNTNAIKPNWEALVPDDDPSLSLSIEATASGATYVFRAFGDTFNVVFESKQGTFDDVFAPTSVTPTVLVSAGQTVIVPPGVGNVGIDDTVLPSEPGLSYTVRFRGTSGGTVVSGERAYTLPEVIQGATLVPDELPLGRTTLLFNVEANVACTVDYSLTSIADSIHLTNYWVQGTHNELVSPIDIGNSFEATSNLTVVAFCRLPLIQYGELNDSIRVRLWDDDTQTVLHERLVGPGAYLNGNMRCETLETPIALVQGKRYTISQVCIDGMADLWVYNYDSTDTSTINSLVGTAASAWFHDGIGWPDSPWSNSWPSVGLLAVAPTEEGSLTLGNDNPLTAQHRFESLTPDTEYTCLYNAITPSTTVTRALTATTLAQIDPPITVDATLAPPDLPQGRTALVAEVNVSKAGSVELVLTGSSGEVYTQNYTQTGPGSVPRTFDGLTPGTLYTLNATASALQGDEATVVVSASTLPPQLEIVASLSTPAENSGTSLVANFAVSRSASVRLTLTAEGETYEQEIQEGTQSFVFQGLTPSTLYTLIAIATAIPDGSEASASDTESTQAPTPPMLISVDLTSTVGTERPPVSGSAPTDDGHIVPFEGEYGAWNAILTTSGQQLYEKNNLLNGSQEETSIGVVVNSNSAQHYTYGFYDGGTKTNVGEDVIGLATPQNTGTLLEGYFTGLDDSKRYSVRMFGQHVNQAGVGSVNFAKLGVNGDKKDTGPDTATCTWYAVAPSGGIINFTLEYVNPLGNNEYASLGGFQLLEEVD